jgi:hypothetical protein
MTDEMMTLRSLVERAPDADLLREMIGFAAERLMELEVGGLTGAPYGEKMGLLKNPMLWSSNVGGSPCVRTRQHRRRRVLRLAVRASEAIRGRGTWQEGLPPAA